MGALVHGGYRSEADRWVGRWMEEQITRVWKE